ncbi:MAG: hypothetical protein K9G33_15940 [Sneathiella sp.]|nr:hypothetical protein [Sneathiella sp.]
MIKLATGVLALSLLAVPALADNDGRITVTNGDVTATITNGGGLSQNYGGINVGNVTAALGFAHSGALNTESAPAQADGLELTQPTFSMTAVGVHTYYETGFTADFNPIDVDITGSAILLNTDVPLPEDGEEGANINLELPSIVDLTPVPLPEGDNGDGEIITLEIPITADLTPVPLPEGDDGEGANISNESSSGSDILASLQSLQE